MQLSVARPPGLLSAGSVVVAHGVSCSSACGILLHARISCIDRQILTTEPPGKHLYVCIFKGIKPSLDFLKENSNT